LSGLSKNEQSSRHEDVSIDQFSGGVDFLMDENILTNDSREEDEHGRLVRTPNNNIKNQNAVNVQSKKMKTSGKASQQPKSSTVSHNVSQQ
jgi:hypothetical protein